MVFKKAGREKKYTWEWGDEYLETVKYLSMWFGNNNSKGIDTHSKKNSGSNEAVGENREELV